MKEKFTFMSLDDAKKLEKSLAPNKKALIIGAGLIGLKCAEGILKRVAHITVLDLAPRILSSILDDDGAKIVQSHLESKSIEFKLSASVKKFEKDTAILESGEKIPFDVLVLAVGVRPNTALLKGIAKIDKGIEANQKSETSAPDIYAAGDCTQTLDISCGQNKIMALLPNAYMQGECAGINMAGGEKKFDNAIPMNAIGFFGLHIVTKPHSRKQAAGYDRFQAGVREAGADCVCEVIFPQFGNATRCGKKRNDAICRGNHRGCPKCEPKLLNTYNHTHNQDVCI
ncbi:hypothetical protein R83H12_03038 [Fibrobacteria bacterium R8-3-H12]